mgnify:CR=1 FL=1
MNVSQFEPFTRIFNSFLVNRPDSENVFVDNLVRPFYIMKRPFKRTTSEGTVK